MKSFTSLAPFNKLSTLFLTCGLLAPSVYIITDASIALGVAAFRNWFRFYSVVTILILVALASLAFSYVPEIAANQPTPWFGLSERISQYAHGLWHAMLALVLLVAKCR